MKNYLRIIYNKKFQYLVLGILFVSSAFFRLSGVITNSFPFTYDIGRDLIAAREIATLEKLTLIGPTTGLEGVFYGPSWYYFLAILYYPLFGNPTLYTGFIVVTGLAVVIISFLLGKKIAGTLFAFIWAGLLAFSPVVVSLTNQVWNPTLIPILWIVSFFLLYFIFKKKRITLSIFLLGFVGGLIIDMEIVAGSLYFIGLVLGLLVTIPKQFSVRNLLLGLIGFFLVLAPRVVFDIRHENIMSKALIDGLLSMFAGGGANSTTPLVQKLTTLFSLWSDTLSMGNRMLGGIILVAVILATFIFYKKGSDVVRFFLKITIVVLLVSTFGILLFGHDIWSHYLVIFPLLFSTWIALVFTLIYQSKKYPLVIITLSVALVLFNANLFSQINNLREPLWEGNAAVYRNQVTVVDYIYAKANGKPFKYIVYTPPVHDYTYRYLFTWLGETKYHTNFNSDNSDYLFVIIEPDEDQPGRADDWLELRKDDGEIIEESIVAGGIIVQMRQLRKE